MNIIVTGACSGIGKALTDIFINSGKKVLGIDINHSKNDNELYQHMIFDLANPEEIIDREEELNIFENFDALVNVAGITIQKKESLEKKYDDFCKTLKVNLFAPYLLSEKFYDSRKEPFLNSSIVNISSIGANQGFPDNPAYCSSKGGLESLTRSMSVDFYKKKVRVNCVRPGYTETPMNTISLNDPIKKNNRSKHTVMNRWGQPREIAQAIEFLISEKSSYITGNILTVDGGWSIKGLI